MPPCTLSQLIAYLDAENHAVAIVHQYKLANGQLGGSGLPDPKYLVHGGTIYQALPEVAPRHRPKRLPQRLVRKK
jgi:hypothetical protein